MDYQSLYPWAESDVLCRSLCDVSCITLFTSTKRIRNLHHTQALSQTSSEEDVIVVPYKPEEPICRDCMHESPFYFFL